MSVIFGTEKYTGQIEISEENAIITLAEWHEWNNGREAVLPRNQFAEVVEALEAALDGKNFVRSFMFGSAKYTGRLSPNGIEGQAALLEVTEWSDWNNGEEAIIFDAQAREIIAALS